ncbi:MAG TPA: four helix bundle protein [Thermoanaerobaculia bacterium]|nr:four helix bundle protein [Thermoanaerobaculia bacterium]
MSDGSEIRERVFTFACSVVSLHDVLVTRGGSARDLSRQLMRAATSIGANLEEADAGQSRADFISKCSISLKEARESLYWLRLLRATNKLDASNDALIHECDRIVAVLTAIVKKTKGAG